MLTKMHKFTPFLRYFEGEDGGGGGVTGSDGTDNVSGEDQGAEQQVESINPAWEPMLKGIPSSLHPMVTPHLRQWDQNFQTELQKVQSPYEPYKSLIDQGVSAEALQQALTFYQTVEADPERVFREMQQYYGFGQDQGQQEQVQDSEELNLGDDDVDPRLAELMQNQEAMAQLLVSQHEKEAQAALEQQVETEVATIKESHPELTEADETMMYRIAIANGITLTEAAQELFSYTESIQQSALAGRSPAPAVMSATGSIPADPPIDPRSLDAKGTKALVASIIANRQ